ncbi:hypothetical protein QWZ13_09630 [Reinekea marina]|uniref:Uncharacterized protein n=1 Tax=Reinekea marina TaxID=1310421 RepID=A0ABV7WS38_9GAMM|nr:hypothetical protein [Reinekea marina]MDN3649170.1 hypothetical protein [Reinekea marina]
MEILSAPVAGISGLITLLATGDIDAAAGVQKGVTESFVDGTAFNRASSAAVAELGILGASGQLAIGVMGTPVNKFVRAGTLSHGVGNYMGSVTNLSNVIYGTSEENNIVKEGYKAVSEAITGNEKAGELTFNLVDLGLGLAVASTQVPKSGSAVIKSGPNPLKLEAHIEKTMITDAAGWVIANDIYQLGSTLVNTVKSALNNNDEECQK